MTVRHDWPTGLDRADWTTVEAAVAFVREVDTATVLAGLLPALSTRARSAVAAHCALAHAAELVFPSSLDALLDSLRAAGLSTAAPVASVVVRDRLSHRHGLPADGLAVTIVPVLVPAVDGVTRMVELFVLPVTQLPVGAEPARIAERERAEGNERHLALDVGAADEVVLAGLRALLVDQGGLAPDGGGHNATENCTVLYFRSPGAGLAGYRRLELRARGHHAQALAAHLASSPKAPAEQLLTLLTGAWTTQAITVAAELGLADHLPAPVGELAERLAVDPDALARLLRYLAALGLVAPAADDSPDRTLFHLTTVGELLRHDGPHSLRALALLYGGPFYESFGHLGTAVRTGREAFEQHFGRHHFGYFAERPALAALFDAAMAASAPMFEPVPALLDLAGTRVVVDVAGGNGELLGRCLNHAPHLRGVLFEQAHVLDRARVQLAEAGCADRCELVPGDFTKGLPADGDLYLLSRVLHDWDDEQCLAILRRCAQSIRPGARLALVERLLPTDASPSLAVAWDLHMLCNVGGRERTADHYARLLATTGFELESVHRLPLDGNLLQARRLPTDADAPH